MNKVILAQLKLGVVPLLFLLSTGCIPEKTKIMTIPTELSESTKSNVIPQQVYSKKYKTTGNPISGDLNNMPKDKYHTNINAHNTHDEHGSHDHEDGESCDDEQKGYGKQVTEKKSHDSCSDCGKEESNK